MNAVELKSHPELERRFWFLTLVSMTAAYICFVCAVYDIVKDVVNQRFQGGFHVFGLDSDGVGYVMDKYNQSLVAPQTMQAAEDAKKKIVAGQIKVVDRMTQ